MFTRKIRLGGKVTVIFGNGTVVVAVKKLTEMTATLSIESPPSADIKIEEPKRFTPGQQARKDIDRSAKAGRRRERQRLPRRIDPL